VDVRFFPHSFNALSESSQTIAESFPLIAYGANPNFRKMASRSVPPFPPSLREGFGGNFLSFACYRSDVPLAAPRSFISFVGGSKLVSSLIPLLFF